MIFIKKIARNMRAIFGTIHRLSDVKKLVPGAGIEPARRFRARDFKSLVSTNFTTRAIGVF